MLGLLSIIILLCATALVVGGIHRYTPFNYQTAPTLFLLLYAGIIAVTAGMFPLNLLLFEPLFWFCVACFSALFLLGMLSINVSLDGRPLYGYQTLSRPFLYLAYPTVLSSLVLVTELITQTILWYTLAWELIVVFNSLIIAMTLCALVVFLIYTPALWLMGRTYGGFFLGSNTGLAFIMPIMALYQPAGAVLFFGVLLSIYLAFFTRLYLYPASTDE